MRIFRWLGAHKLFTTALIGVGVFVLIYIGQLPGAHYSSGCSAAMSPCKFDQRHPIPHPTQT